MPDLTTDMFTRIVELWNASSTRFKITKADKHWNGGTALYIDHRFPSAYRQQIYVSTASPERLLAKLERPRVDR